MTFPAVAVPVLSLLILALVISGYLASLRSPDRSTNYLLASFIFQALWSLAVLLDMTGPSAVWAATQFLTGAFAYWAMLQFCYTFLEQPFGREYRLVWWITLGATIAAVLVGLVGGLAVMTVVLVATMVLLSVWSAVVLMRKVKLLTRRDEPDATMFQALLRTRSRAARAQRAVLVPVGIVLSIIFMYALVMAEVVPGVVYNVWLRIGLLLGLMAFALIQFTYGRERHSVQIKLVGTALTIVLSVLAFASMIVIEPIEGPGPSVLAARMALVVVAASLATIVGFPLAYRASLLGPIENLLQGIRRVDDGQLDTEVPVLVNDEIGEVTRSFNGMTRSLRNYSGRLEALVAERTAELERSLRELEAAQARLVEQEKMASLGALTAGIAHEIKNPLNFVNNFATLLTELVGELRETLDTETRDDNEQRLILADLEQNAAKVAEHGRRADAIVRSMLMHSRGAGGERRAVDINELVTEYANLAYHGIRAQHSDFSCELEWALAAGLPPVDGVEQDLGRVLLNIANNAFYAVHDPSRTNGRVPGRVSIQTAHVGETVEIRISDTGPGIPEDVRRRIFEPFYTTKPPGEGTGLGLSMSHDIVVQGHGGRIAVESTEGHGATFVIALPASANEGPNA